MAMNKTAGESRAKKSAAKGGSAKKAAPKKAAGAAKKAAPKKAAGPKLSEPQKEMLRKVAGADPTGYLPEKKPENKTLETLLKNKLVKRGKKHAASGSYYYQISSAGKKHLESLAGAGAASSSAPKSS